MAPPRDMPIANSIQKLSGKKEERKRERKREDREGESE